MNQILIQYLPADPPHPIADCDGPTDAALFYTKWEKEHRAELGALLSPFQVGTEYFVALGTARVSSDDPGIIVDIVNQVLSDKRFAAFAVSSDGEFYTDDIRMPLNA